MFSSCLAALYSGRPQAFLLRGMDDDWQCGSFIVNLGTPVEIALLAIGCKPHICPSDACSLERCSFVSWDSLGDLAGLISSARKLAGRRVVQCFLCRENLHELRLGAADGTSGKGLQLCGYRTHPWRGLSRKRENVPGNDH